MKCSFLLHLFFMQFIYLFIKRPCCYWVINKHFIFIFLSWFLVMIWKSFKLIPKYWLSSSLTFDLEVGQVLSSLHWGQLVPAFGLLSAEQVDNRGLLKYVWVNCKLKMLCILLYFSLSLTTFYECITLWSVYRILMKKYFCAFL